MKTDERASEAGLHIKYVGNDTYWIDGFVLFAASAIALAVSFWFVANGVSASAVSRAMVWLSFPWFVGLYFLSKKLRQMTKQGFEIVLYFGALPQYAVSLLFVLWTFSHLVRAFTAWL
ncbi:hypothetical protein [Bradyrhizobium sp.]|jgi:FtsH-binding integral membrane protein|uniref:hypothetical protein n=1 Tax=Bradyrhizobium sp. TaxID=376 RepID=UPI003C24A36E